MKLLAFDEARLAPKREQKLRGWLVRFADGTAYTLENATLINTDSAFAKFQDPDGSITLVPVHAISLIRSSAPTG